MLDLGDTIASHALLLHSLELKKDVALFLEDSIAEFQKSQGLVGLRTSEELQEESLTPGKTCCWPLSDGYMDLARGVRELRTSAEEEYDAFESSRTRLREGRKRRSH
jgi:hypothetical protein